MILAVLSCPAIEFSDAREHLLPLLGPWQDHWPEPKLKSGARYAGGQHLEAAMISKNVVNDEKSEILQCSLTVTFIYEYLYLHFLYSIDTSSIMGRCQLFHAIGVLQRITTSSRIFICQTQFS